MYILFCHVLTSVCCLAHYELQSAPFSSYLGYFGQISTHRGFNELIGTLFKTEDFKIHQRRPSDV